VHEVPPLALFLDREADRERADSHRRHHLLHRRLPEDSIRFVQERELHFDHELREIGRRGP
jgi:hypothetical protein